MFSLLQQTESEVYLATSILASVVCVQGEDSQQALKMALVMILFPFRGYTLRFVALWLEGRHTSRNFCGYLVSLMAIHGVSQIVIFFLSTERATALQISGGAIPASRYNKRIKV